MKVKRNLTAQPLAHLSGAKNRVTEIEDLHEVSGDDDMGKQTLTINDGPNSKAKLKSGILTTTNQASSQLTSPSSVAVLDTLGGQRIRHSMERMVSTAKNKAFISHTKSNGFASQKLLNDPSVLNHEI